MQEITTFKSDIADLNKKMNQKSDELNKAIERFEKISAGANDVF